MIVAAVQVRMRSRRLPGKVLADIAGHPLLWHMVHRLRATQRVDRVVIATSHEPADAPIRKFADAHGIAYFAGSETDLIDRLYRTARHFRADALVRVTGDSPLVDPDVVDGLIVAYQAHVGDVEYVTNALPPTYPVGLDAEVFPVATLERCCREIRDPFWREWFPVYLAEHRTDFRIINVPSPVDRSALRWTVDHEADLTFVRAIYDRLSHAGGRIFRMDDVLSCLDAEPSLKEINGHYDRYEGYTLALAASQRASEAR